MATIVTVTQSETDRTTATPPRSGAMAPGDGINETREVERVIERLCRDFPELDESEIRRIMAEAISSFNGSRVRKFVPLLAERAAKQECRQRRVVDLTDGPVILP